MHIQSLQLTFFRNYEALQIDFAKGVNCITGKNGAGKTNILDALHFLSMTRGFRSSQDKQAVKEAESFFLIAGKWGKSEEIHHLQCNFMAGKGKKILLNGNPLEKFSEHIGNLPLVAVLPSDTELINGGGTVRREFVDSLISQYNRNYLQHLILYKKCLEQRNALLKSFGENRYFDKDQLALWNMQIIPAGRYIWAERQVFLKAFLPIFEKYFHQIVSAAEIPTISYESKIKENTAQEWHSLLEENEMRDRVNQNSSIGTHKDDWSFLIHDISAKHYGSQGQQKTFTIALKLAQYDLLAAQKGYPPLLLLDDIFDKLDNHRLESIAQILDKHIEGQVFITDTSHERLATVFANSKREIKFFSVEKGQVK